MEKELFARAQLGKESNFWDYPAERKAIDVRAQRVAEEQRRDGGMGRGSMGGTLAPHKRQDWQQNGSAGQGSWGSSNNRCFSRTTP